MFDVGLVLLIVLAIAIGWFLGRYERTIRYYKVKTGDDGVTHVPKEYFEGLNYLLNEQPDQAVDLFAKTLDVNSDTVEIYLALGSNFRKRGEVDRAIKVHQNLLTRPNLERHHRASIQLALGCDYLAAGLLDRAERLLLDLIQQQGEHTDAATVYLIKIYEQEKEWGKAIEHVKQLIARSEEPDYQAIAHYYCEYAEQKLKTGNLTDARQQLAEALRYNKRCVRASLLLGQLEFSTERHLEAIKVLKNIRIQDPAYIPESIPLLAESYERINRESEIVNYLQVCLDSHPSVALLMLLADQTERFYGTVQAATLVANYMEIHPSFAVLDRLIKYRNELSPKDLSHYVQVLRGLLLKLGKNEIRYFCPQCGFKGKTLYWCCPSCQRWGSFRPLTESESIG